MSGSVSGFAQQDIQVEFRRDNCLKYRFLLSSCGLPPKLPGRDVESNNGSTPDTSTESPCPRLVN